MPKSWYIDPRLDPRAVGANEFFAGPIVVSAMEIELARRGVL